MALSTNLFEDGGVNVSDGGGGGGGRGGREGGGVEGIGTQLLGFGSEGYL